MKDYLFPSLMIRSHKGFILPLTVVMLLMISGYVLHEIQIYQTEKKFIHEQEQLYKMIRLTHLAAVHLDEQWHDSDQHDFLYDYHNPNGTVYYQISPLPEQVEFSHVSAKYVIYVELVATTRNNKESRHHSYMYYNVKEDDILRWVESVSVGS